MLLLILESLGTTEIILIAVVALVIFGPRKLPQLSRSLAKSLGEFKRASEDFKRTWEKEVSLEEMEKEARIGQAMIAEDNSILDTTVERSRAVRDAADEDETKDKNDAVSSAAPPAISTVDASSQHSLSEAATDAPITEPMRKRDWL